MGDALQCTLEAFATAIIDVVDANPQNLTPVQLRVCQALDPSGANEQHVTLEQLVDATQDLDLMRAPAIDGWHAHRPAPLAMGNRQPVNVHQAYRADFVDEVAVRLQTMAHPVVAPQANTTVFFFIDYITPVIRSLSHGQRLNAHQLRLVGAYRIAIRYPVPDVNILVGPDQVVLNGRCPIVITRDGVPVCVVELTNAVNEQALDRAFVYAAALAPSIRTRSIRMIVTNLHDWRLLRINPNRRSASRLYTVQHHPTGMPTNQAIDEMHRLLLGFLYEA